MTKDKWLEGVMRDQVWSAISDALGSLGYELNNQEAVEAFVEDLLAKKGDDR